MAKINLKLRITRIITCFEIKIKTKQIVSAVNFGRQRASQNIVSSSRGYRMV
jgi:imidazole glycerol phosphate synthase subunit HisF